MPIVQYTPERFGSLRETAAAIDPHASMTHRPFVDYYYATCPSCWLYLFLSEDGKVLATLGAELAPFQFNSRDVTIVVCSNWHSTRPGLGRALYKHGMSTVSDAVALEFTATSITIQIIRHYGWVFLPGIRGYFLNNPYKIYPGDSWPRRVAKSMARRLTARRIPSFASRIPSEAIEGISVREEYSYTEDLLPRRSPFVFRFAPDAEYLAWRYNTALSFVRYRLFRVVVRGTNFGYVVINESPGQLIVAQCDGEEAEALAYAVVLSILEVGRNDEKPRPVFLTSSHPVMQRVFERVGFRAQRGEVSFALNFTNHPMEMSPDTSNWLVNYDWGDNGLRAPFLDQPPSSCPSSD